MNKIPAPSWWVSMDPLKYEFDKEEKDRKEKSDHLEALKAIPIEDRLAILEEFMYNTTH